jgi:hypothetical protein
MGTRSVEADRGITPTIAHAPAGIVHEIDPPNGGFEKVPTNNHVERTNRMFRLLEKVRYKWRERKTLVRFVVLTLDGIWRGWSPAKVDRATLPEPVSSGEAQGHAGKRSRQVA